jgi:Ser/Thr protein kinase RdoA (MazF antagonist)
LIGSRRKDAFGWPTDALWSVAHTGENETWRVDTGSGSWAAKRYREGATREAVEAEAAWWRVLVDVDPRVVDDGERVWLVTPWLAGDSPEPDWKRLGRLVRELHRRAEAVAEPRHWPGWRRPSYGREQLVDGPLRRLGSAPFLTTADRDRVRRLAARVPEPATPATAAFVHMDVHFGNVIATAERWHVIDFEECGFGSSTLDLGVARSHLRGQGTFDRDWPAFAAGYGPLAEDVASVAAGAALRLLYMLGKLPNRLDVPHVAANPARLVRRYLDFLEAELALTTATR